MTVQTKTPIGLDGVAAAETALSRIDGEKGELIIAGSRIDDLALDVSFEALAARLWSAATAKPMDEEKTAGAIGRAREEAFAELPRILAASDGLPLTEGLRAGVAALRPMAGIAPEVMLVGAMPVIAAALVRRAAGETPVEPSAKRSHAADFLTMLTGSAPARGQAAALNAYLVTVSDHGMNASTFTARVVASTKADLVMAVTAAYCALTGPLHGGAPEPVLDMLDAIGSRENIVSWVDAALARGDRLMGFGHRVYRVRDPRADVLKRALGLVAEQSGDPGLAAEVEAYAREALAKAKPDRKLDTNVEFYTAILLDALKFPRQAFTPVFAVARTAGWTAHALEQQRIGRLLRPASLYTGPVPD